LRRNGAKALFIWEGRKTMQSTARVAIIGGGMMGCGLLYHLAEEGWTDSLLIEKGELTSGSTWHAAGQCPSFIADYNMAKVHHYGNTLYPKLESLTGQYVSWHGCGGIRFALTPEELDYFKHVEGISRMVGFRMEIIGPEEIRKINPFVTTDGVLAGALTFEDGHVDPAGCCNALAKGARDMGASIVRNNRVTDITRRPNGEWEVVTEQGTVVCEHVVNAAGCYARQISQMVGADVPITNMEHTYLVTEPIKEFLERDEEMPVMRDPYPSAYYRQEQKAALIGIYETAASAECWTHHDGWPEWDAENELFSADMDRILPYIERVLERMPIWAEAGIKRIVCGAIPHTPDNNPLIGPAAGVRNFWQSCGAAIGIAQHGDAEINMAGIDPRRFGAYAPGGYTKAKSHEDYEHMYILHLPGEERMAGRPARTSALYEKLKVKGASHTEAHGCVVFPRRPRRRARLPPQQHLRGGGRGMPRGARARRGPGPVQLRQVRGHGCRCGGLPRPRAGQPHAEDRRRYRARAFLVGGGTHRRRGDGNALGPRSLLPALRRRSRGARPRSPDSTSR
jgi:dimethylglycine dehydrogenase